jgi:hypothetical protein
MQNLTPAADQDELFLMDGICPFIEPVQAMIRPFNGSVLMHYPFISQVNRSQRPATASMRKTPNSWYIRRIWNTQTSQIRPVWKAHPIRGELEIIEFGRAMLEEKFANTSRVASLPFVTFIDGFGLYRNMYRKLMGFYFIPAGLPFQERTRRTNVIPFTLGPHGTNMANVVEAIGPCLRPLDRGEFITLPGDDSETMVCAFTLFYIGDMPQQQENSGMLSVAATYGCRFCYVASTDRSDLNFDIVERGRFHFETQRLRQYMEVGERPDVNTDAKRKAFGRDHSMLPYTPSLQKLSPTLDILITRPGDPAHSEYKGLTQLLHNLVIDMLLSGDNIKNEYAKVLRSFPLPPSWGKLQSPITHLGSYTLSEHARWSGIAPILFRTWLTDAKLQKHFKEVAPLEMDKVVQHLRQLTGVDQIPVYALVVRTFAALARSNMNLMSNKLTL